MLDLRKKCDSGKNDSKVVSEFIFSCFFNHTIFCFCLKLE